MRWPHIATHVSHWTLRVCLNSVTAERNRDLGLNELGRSYKAGMLKFKKHPLGRGPGGPGMNPVKGRGGGGGGKKKGRKSQLKLPF